MASSVAQLKKYRVVFAWFFVISFAALLVSTVLFMRAGPARESPTAGEPASERRPRSGRPTPPSEPRPEENRGAAQQSSGLTLSIVIPLLTSTTSLMAFLLTAGMTWRKERREQLHSDLDLERKRLEIEKLQRELELERSERERLQQGVDGGDPPRLHPPPPRAGP